MAKKNERVSLRLPEETKARLDRIVGSAGGTLTAVLELAVEDLLRDGEEVASLKLRNRQANDPAHRS